MDVILKKDERIDDLEYKNLKIIQNKNNFCFGIDSVILSDFAKEIKKDSIAIDIGTGTGIIAILLAGKTEAKKIIGIEIQQDVAEMAERSVCLNKLNNRIQIINEDIRNIQNIEKIIKKGSVDAIVTNPPYKKDETGLKNTNENKLISRHEIKCNLEDVIKSAECLLKDKGVLYMVHRPDRLADIVQILRKYNIEPKILRFVYPNIEKEPNLILIKAVKNAKAFLKVEKPLFVYKKEGEYTDEILKIYNKEIKK